MRTASKYTSLVPSAGNARDQVAVGVGLYLIGRDGGMSFLNQSQSEDTPELATSAWHKNNTSHFGSLLVSSTKITGSVGLRGWI